MDSDLLIDGASLPSFELGSAEGSMDGPRRRDGEDKEFPADWLVRDVRDGCNVGALIGFVEGNATGTGEGSLVVGPADCIGGKF